MAEYAVMAENLTKRFTLHHQGPAVLTALENVSLKAPFGKCLAVSGPSGCGKSTLLRCLYGNYRITEGRILVFSSGGWVSLADSSERGLLDLRRESMSMVSQFLRVIPRVPALEIVAAPLLANGVGKAEALERAAQALASLRVPERLWRLPPLTFSGGEKQRVNIARGLIKESPILLLDEPTASLDRENREIVSGLIVQAKSRGACVIGVFHDREVREKTADFVLELTPPGGGKPEGSSDSGEDGGELLSAGGGRR